MPQLTPAQITSLRTHPHRLGNAQYLYVFQPPTIFAAEVNPIPPIPGYDIQYIPVTNITTGAITSVRRGHTLWIGSAPGLKDGGIVRIRRDGAPGDTTINVSEHETYLSAAPTIYLTVKDEFRLWHVSPFFVGPTIYKDCDDILAPTAIAFPGANQIYQPVPVLGPHSVEFVDPTTGVATHDFDWSRSWAIAPGAVTYAATFPGGTPPNSAAASGTVTWATPGARWVDLIVTDTNGIPSYAGHRLYITLDPDNLPDNCYVAFTPGPRQGDVGSGGFGMDFTVYVEASEDDFPDGALVIWFFDGGTQEDIGGNWPYRSHIHFIGYIRRGSTHKEPEIGSVTFEAETIQNLMKSLPTFPNFLEINAAPTVWTQAAGLTVQRAATLHMRWQSTLLEIADVLFVPDADTAIGEHEFPEGDLYSQLNSLVNRDYLYRIGCDPLGTIYFNKDPQFLPRPGAWLPPVGIDTIMTIEPEDWQGAIDLPEPLLPETAHVLGSGIAYPPATPLFSHAPGPVPLEFGKKDASLSRLILVDQAGLNVLTGLVLAQANDDFPDVSVPLGGQYYIGHLFPMEFVGLDIHDVALPYGTKRDVDLSGEKFIPRRSQLQVVYDEDGAPSHAMISLNLEKLTYGVAGRTLLYPTGTDDLTVPDADEGPSGGGWLPPAPPIPGGGEGPDGETIYFLNQTNNHLYRSRNILHPAVDVVYEDLGALPVGIGIVRWIDLDPFNSQNCAVVCGTGGVYISYNLDGVVPTWSLLLSAVGTMDQFQVEWSRLRQGRFLVAGHFWWAIVPVGWIETVFTFDGYALTGSAAMQTVGGLKSNAESPRVECSPHDEDIAWCINDQGGGNFYVARTSNFWSSWVNTAVTSWSVVLSLHHRYANNVNDNFALYGHGDVDAMPNGDALITRCLADVGVCNTANLGNDMGDETYQVGSGFGYTDRYWALTGPRTGYPAYWLFYVSDDGIVWTLQYIFFPVAVRHIRDWPYDPNRFYGCCDGGPIMVSVDRGLNWTNKAGNWAALGGGGTIACCTVVGGNPSL